MMLLGMERWRWEKQDFASLEKTASHYLQKSVWRIFYFEGDIVSILFLQIFVYYEKTQLLIILI